MKKIITIIAIACAIFSVFCMNVSAATTDSVTTRFVFDMYDTCLGRHPGFSEMMNWYNTPITGREMAYEFLTSDEFLDRDLTEAEIINVYFNVFFNTDATQTEIDFWEDRITVDDQTILFYGLINCPQYEEICNDYGIDVGNNFLDNDAFTAGTCPDSADCGLTDAGNYVFYINVNGNLYYHEVMNAAA